MELDLRMMDVLYELHANEKYVHNYRSANDLGYLQH